jgi:hypothetical protein
LIASSHASSEETTKKENWTGPGSVTPIVERMDEIHRI